jgi:hypothetical protein
VADRHRRRCSHARPKGAVMTWIDIALVTFVIILIVAIKWEEQL